jgi:PPK2 family polyphosphate:nucleotide phosphotransferase
MKKIDINDFLFDGNEKFSIKKSDTKIKDFYENEEDYEAILAEFHQKIDELQSMMYAHNRYGLLMIFQAMDAAGKDSTIKNVFAGINPLALRTLSFKRPSETELDHDYLWRTTTQMPERGTITIFNRSYYEEVLVVKVHSEILTNIQHLPLELTNDLEKVWENRYEDIANFEKYLHHNGIRVLKFFLNISKQEQGKRLIERIEDATKNWKFEEQDIKERDSWNEYMSAYEKAINATATKKNPWYIIPADDKKNMRLIVAKIILENLQSLDINYPEADAARQEVLRNLIAKIKEQDAL